MSRQITRQPFSRNTFVNNIVPGSKGKKTKFPEELNTPVDMKKVNLESVKPWIASRITGLLGGVEDEVLIGMIYSYLEDTQIDPKVMMVNLTSFLEKNASLFMKELWAMLVSAQESEDGVPMQLIRAKEEEIRKRKEEIARIQESLLKKSHSNNNNRLKESYVGDPNRASNFSNQAPVINPAEIQPDVHLPQPPPIPEGGLKERESRWDDERNSSRKDGERKKYDNDGERKERRDKEPKELREHKERNQRGAGEEEIRSGAKEKEREERKRKERKHHSRSRSPTQHKHRRQRSVSPLRRRPSRSPLRRRDQSPEAGSRRREKDAERSRNDDKKDKHKRHHRDRSPGNHPDEDAPPAISEEDGSGRSGEASKGRETKEASPTVELSAAEEGALKVIRATEAKVNTLEGQVLGRIESGQAGVKEVEAVLEFLHQALEAMDGVNVHNSAAVRAVRKKMVKRINSIMDHVDVMKEKVLAKRTMQKEENLVDAKLSKRAKRAKFSGSDTSKSGKSNSESGSSSGSESGSESESESDKDKN
eukprot:CAMPEP_0196587410 /NCGR_PEP_ID=MMETSP1081-20130531/57393_1 /TAXON_ID=36882 /ORGANISM="Pyramimonas amylifera, Strain CCMP720" /LENGTH=534 /DNA_ID=CAMNT_0041909593 /DNA_START=92 /DNA_END=1696 /DNA_ORIENTATION=+